jgi:hypothetical protein
MFRQLASALCGDARMEHAQRKLSIVIDDDVDDALVAPRFRALTLAPLSGLLGAPFAGYS